RRWPRSSFGNVRWRRYGLRFQQRQLLLRQPHFVLVVGANDSLHQVMTHHVAFVEVYERQSVDALQDFDRFDQTAAARGGQVDLRDVAGDHRLGTKSQAGDEHLHLLRGRVLRLVQDDERIVQRAPAHESDGRNLDDVFFQITLDALRVEHVEERVVQRPQIGIDLLLQGAGEKAETFARLNRRPRQNDAIDLLVQQRGDCHGYGEVGLASAGGADAKHHVVLLDGLEVAALVGAFRLDGAASKRTLASGFGEPAESHVRIADHHA